MAQDIVGGLFGITPEMYQQNKQQQQMAEAIKMGSLTPEQFVGTQAYRGGQAAGNVLGGLMGVEDPQLQAIRGAQSVVSKYDINTSAGLKSITQELQQLAQSTGNSAYMGMAQDSAKKYQATLLNEAAVAQKTREHAITPQNQAEANKLTALQAKYPATVEGRAQAADEFATWKSEFKQKEAAAGAVKPASNISSAVKDYQGTVKPYTDTMDAAETVISLLNEAATGSNPTAFEGARVQLAKAMGDGKLSRKDIEAAGGDPSIAGMLTDKTSVLFTGTPSKETMREMARASNILKKAAQVKKDTLTMQQRDIAEKEFNFTPEQLDRQFPLTPKPAKLPPAGTSPKKVMTWEEFTRPQ